MMDDVTPFARVSVQLAFLGNGGRGTNTVLFWGNILVYHSHIHELSPWFNLTCTRHEHGLSERKSLPFPAGPSSDAPEDRLCRS